MLKQILAIVCHRFCNITIKEISQNYTISQHYAQEWKSQVSCDGKSFSYLHEKIILDHIMIKWHNVTYCDCTGNVMESLFCQRSLIWCGLPHYIVPAIPTTANLVFTAMLKSQKRPSTIVPFLIQWVQEYEYPLELVWTPQVCIKPDDDHLACSDSLPQSFLF